MGFALWQKKNHYVPMMTSWATDLKFCVRLDNKYGKYRTPHLERLFCERQNRSVFICRCRCFDTDRPSVLMIIKSYSRDLKGHWRTNTQVTDIAIVFYIFIHCMHASACMLFSFLGLSSLFLWTTSIARPWWPFTRSIPSAARNFGKSKLTFWPFAHYDVLAL